MGSYYLPNDTIGLSPTVWLQFQMGTFRPASGLGVRGDVRGGSGMGPFDSPPMGSY